MYKFIIKDNVSRIWRLFRRPHCWWHNLSAFFRSSNAAGSSLPARYYQWIHPCQYTNPQKHIISLYKITFLGSAYAAYSLLVTCISCNVSRIVKFGSKVLLAVQLIGHLHPNDIILYDKNEQFLGWHTRHTGYCLITGHRLSSVFLY